jgi:hypothetical protein
MIDHLSPREYEEVERAAAGHQPWARVLRAAFLYGTRLVLGMDAALGEGRIAAAAGLPRDEVRGALAVAARWCAGHGLHLLGFPGELPGDEWRHFMAVG